MARFESVAVAGYYPTPFTLVPRIASLLDVTAVRDEKLVESYGRGERVSFRPFSFLDPCAGDGVAVVAAAHALFGAPLPSFGVGPTVEFYACELEVERARKLKRFIDQHERRGAYHVKQGDAFTLTWDNAPGVNVLWLNPPYDVDPLFKRLEQAYLQRFTPALIPGFGALVFIVPHYALNASAEYLATNYSDLRCVRFPAKDFEAFKQVVVVARRRVAPLPVELATEAIKLILNWATDPASCPALDEVNIPALALRAKESSGLRSFSANNVDLQVVERFLLPWQVGTTDIGKGGKANGKTMPMLESGFEQGMDEFLNAEMRIAMPAKIAYLALLLASGVMNGARAQPDEGVDGWPPLLVKGRFSKDFITVRENFDKEGNLISETQVQQPVLSVTVLTLDNNPRYITLDQGVTPSDAEIIDQANIADLLARYGHSLAEVMKRQFPPMHDPERREELLPLPPLGRELYRAQFDVVQTDAKLLGRDGTAILLGEVGTGKSMCSLAVVEMFGPRHYAQTVDKLQSLGLWNQQHGPKPVERALILCPPHLVKSWRDQIALALPGAATAELREIPDLRQQPMGGAGPGQGITFYILSREPAKLGHLIKPGVSYHRDRAGALQPHCPRCAAPTPEPQKCADKRLRCTVRPLLARNKQVGLLARDMAAIMIRVQDTEQRRALVNQRMLSLRTPGEDSDSRLLWKQAATAQLPSGWSALADLAGKTQNVLWRALRSKSKKDYLGDEEFAALLRANSLLHLAAPEAIREKLVRRTVGKMYKKVAAGGDYRAERWRNQMLQLAVTLFDTNPDGARELTQELAAAHPIIRQTFNSTTVIDQSLNTLDYLEAKHKLFEQCFDHPDQAEDLRKAFRIRQERAGSSAKWTMELVETYGGDGVAWYAGDGDKYSFAGEVATADAALAALIDAAVFYPGRMCGEPLFQATAAPLKKQGGSSMIGLNAPFKAEGPRRYPLAKWIYRNHRAMFDFVIIDEMHEYNNVGSAQEQAAHLLTQLGAPVLGLTGSLMGGYSSSLFANFRALSRAFRLEFSADEKGKFVQRYGYLKVLKALPEAEIKRLVKEYGKASLREEREEDLIIKTLGEAPGVLPLFIPRHLLRMAAVLHKADLDIELPPLVERSLGLRLADGDVNDRAIFANYQQLTDDLIERIKNDRFDPILTGRLLGPLVESSGYLDLATEDTLPHKDEEGKSCYEVRYSKNCGKLAGELVTRVYGVPASHITVKERWLLDTLREQLGRDRNILLFLRHTGSSKLVSRYQKLLARELGVKVVYLDSAKVSTSVREEWINANVIATETRVLIVNPEAVKTGLNCLTPHFTTAIWQEQTNNALTYRQANGRIHRIGSRPDTTIEVIVPVYAETSQETLLDLVARKLTASQQMDGLDIASQLEAAGAGTAEEAQALAQSALLTLGQAMFDILSGKARSRPRTVEIVHAGSTNAYHVAEIEAAEMQVQLFGRRS